MPYLLDAVRTAESEVYYSLQSIVNMGALGVPALGEIIALREYAAEYQDRYEAWIIKDYLMHLDQAIRQLTKLAASTA